MDASCSCTVHDRNALSMIICGIGSLSRGPLDIGRLILMPQPHSPTVRARRLGADLQRLRERAGYATQDEAARRLGWSRFKISRIEGARTKPSTNDLHAMFELYGVGREQAAALLDLAKNAWHRGWWTDYADVFKTSYVALEDEAATIRSLEPQLVPGLLQTADYAREVIRGCLVGASSDDVQRRVQARMARQALLSRPDAPNFHTILDETALSRPIGGPGVARAQLRRLVDEAARPNVTIQLLPTTTGAHVGLEGPFVIFSFADGIDPDIIYSEGVLGNVYVESANGIARCNLLFEEARKAALDPTQTAAHLAALAKE